MLFTQFTIVASALASTAYGANHIIKVGKESLTFSPNNTQAAIGDTLEFKFYASNHTVTQGPFGKPCSVNGTTDLAFSGYIPTTGTGPNAETFTVKVTNSTPMWFYCSQNSPASHCVAGMVMVVNENATSGKTLEAYAAGAKALNPAVADHPGNGDKAQVGTLSGTNNSTGSSTTPSSPSSTGTSTSASGTTTKSSAASSDYSSMNMVAASIAAFGALAFSIAL